MTSQPISTVTVTGLHRRFTGDTKKGAEEVEVAGLFILNIDPQYKIPGQGIIAGFVPIPGSASSFLEESKIGPGIEQEHLPRT